MAYRTSYNMTVQNVKDENQYNALCGALYDRGILSYALYCGELRGITAEFYENCAVKWRYHEKDMIEISKQFPDMVFQLRGQGEDHDDLWQKYFQNGDCEKCRAEIMMPYPTRIKWE